MKFILFLLWTFFVFVMGGATALIMKEDGYIPD